MNKRNIATIAIQTSEKQFRDLLENVHLPAMILDVNGRITYCNPYLLSLTGYTLKEMSGADWFKILIPENNIEIKELFLKGLRNGNIPGHFENSIITKKGELRDILWNNKILKDDSGSVIGTSSIGEDITERKLAEGHIKKLNRIYTVLSNINGAIVRTRDKQLLFNEMCRIAVDDGGFLMAWIGIVNTRTNKVDVVASAGKIGEYLNEINIDLNDEAQSSGPTGIAVKTGKSFFSNNIETDDKMIPWRQKALKSGFRSSITFPIIVSGKTIGAYTLYSDKPDFFIEDEIRLLNELASDISFAIEFIESEKLRKHAVEELERNSALLQSIIEGTTDAIYVKDINGKYQLFNHAAELITGKKSFEVLGKDDTFLFPAEEAAVVMQGDSKIISEMKISTYEEYITASDGKKSTFLSTKGPIIDKNGIPVGLFGVARDITERKRMEIALSESEELFRKAFRSSPIAITITNKSNGKYIEVNNAWCIIYGFSAREAIGHTPVELSVIDTETRELIIDELKTKGKLGNVELSLKDKTGNYHTILFSSETIDFAGEPCVLSTGIDVTDRKLAEEALKENNSRLELAMQSANMAWWEMDIITGNVIFDHRKSGMLGYPAERLMHYKDFMALVHPEDAEKAMKAMRRHIDGFADKYEVEYRILTQSGEYKWFYDIGAIVKKDPNGKPINATGLVIDITDRKLSEQALIEHENKLSTIFNLLPVGISILDHDQKIVFENPALGNILGITSEGLQRGDYLKRKYLRSDGTQKPAEEFASVRAFYEKRPLQNIITGVVKEDGNTVWTNVSAVPVEFPGWKVVLVTTDITERKLAEQELLESQELFSKAFQVGPAGMTITRISDGKFINANESFCKMFEFDRKDVMGHTSTELNMWSPEERKRLIQQQIATGGLHDFELVARSKSGKRIDLLFSSNQTELRGEACHITTMIDITERKKEQEALREREYLLSASQRAAHIGTWSWKVGDTTVYWSDETFRIYGLNPDMGQPRFEFFFEIIHPDDRLKMQEWPTAVIAGLNPPPIEFRVMRPDGIYRLIQTDGDVIETVDGVPSRIAGTAHDITDRKLAEETLKKSESEFRLLAEAMPQIVWITRPDGWNIYFNQQWVDYTGLTLEESYGHGWNKPFHPDDQQRAWEAWQNATENNGLYSIESRLRRADGIYQWWLIRGVPIIDAEGKLFKWFGTCTNINDMKQAEEAIRIHSERLQNLHQIDQAILLALESPEIVVQTAIQYMRSLLHCQHASVGIFNLEKKEVKVFAADIDSKTIVKVGMIIEEEIYGVIDILRKKKIEIVEDMSGIVSPSAINRLLQEEGIRSSINVALVSEMEMYGVLNVGWENSRTITPEETEIASEVAAQITIAIEKARLMKETKQSEEKLEKLVIQRTSQLEAANRELEAFSYSVSHDLRSPLRHIIGYAEILTKEYSDQLPDDARKHLSTMIGSAKKMGTLIDDLLNFSKTGRAELKKSTLKMNQVIEDALAQIKPSLTSRQIDWKISLLPEVYGDYNLLRQAWINLLDNAVKYTRFKENAVIEIGCKEELVEFIFYIQDNGVGFDMKYAEKLFGVFQRLHSTSQFDGTGIGLANMQRIILGHGGRTWAEAETDKGATFYFSIPKKK